MLDELSSELQSHGAALIGFADLREIPASVRLNYSFGISIAAALNPSIVSDIQTGPTLTYRTEYERANDLLDELAVSASDFLRKSGYTTKPFAATNQGINPRTLSTRLPHKTVATRAGLGWIGKCALLVTVPFGSAIRLTTVLTNAKLPTGVPINESRCGNCQACVDVCPGHAPSGKNWNIHLYRDAFFNPYWCRRAARKMAAEKTGIRETFCGMCIAVCPWTQEYIKKTYKEN
jgi:epoxyqueuosine reductase QueG